MKVRMHPAHRGVRAADPALEAHLPTRFPFPAPPPHHVPKPRQPGRTLPSAARNGKNITVAAARLRRCAQRLADLMWLGNGQATRVLGRELSPLAARIARDNLLVREARPVAVSLSCIEVGNAKERERRFGVIAVDTHEAFVGFEGDVGLQVALETEREVELNAGRRARSPRRRASPRRKSLRRGRGVHPRAGTGRRCGRRRGLRRDRRRADSRAPATRAPRRRRDAPSRSGRTRPARRSIRRGEGSACLSRGTLPRFHCATRRRATTRRRRSRTRPRA